MKLNKAVKVLMRRLAYLDSTEQGRSQNALDRIRAEQAALREALFCIGQVQGLREARKEEYEQYKREAAVQDDTEQPKARWSRIIDESPSERG